MTALAVATCTQSGAGAWTAPLSSAGQLLVLTVTGDLPGLRVEISDDGGTNYATIIADTQLRLDYSQAIACPVPAGASVRLSHPGRDAAAVARLAIL
jgi:hypothetical protein